MAVWKPFNALERVEELCQENATLLEHNALLQDKAKEEERLAWDRYVIGVYPSLFGTGPFSALVSDCGMEADKFLVERRKRFGGG